MNTSAFLVELSKLQRNIHNILSQTNASSPLMDEPLESLADALKKFREMDDKDPAKKKVEAKLCEIDQEIEAHEEREILLKRLPDLVYLPKPRKRL